MANIFMVLWTMMAISLSPATSRNLVCQPCHPDEVLNLARSFDKADLVVVAHRTDYPSDEKEPASIKVNVARTLKGKTKEAELTVKSWYGMCPYGIIVDDRTYIMLLSKEDEMYAPVNGGCGVKVLVVKNDQVEVDGNQMSITEVQKKYNLKESH